MEYLLKANAVIILFYLCYKLFLQNETFYQSNRFFLLSGLLVASIIPFIIIPIHIEASITNDNINLSNFQIANNTTAEITNSYDYYEVFRWIYLLGASFFLTRFMIQLCSLVYILLRNTSKKENQFTFIETNDKQTAFSFFKYIVYNPKHFTKEELHQVILHEKIHAKQYHSLDILIIKIATILFWFNPLIWLYNKSLQQNLEFIADNEIQQKISNKKSYQTLLLKTFLSNNQLAIANNFYNSLIKKRIIMLHKSKSNKLNSWKYALILPLLALFLMSFNIKEIYLENNTKENHLASKDAVSSFEVLITKNSNESQLNEIKEVALKQGLKIKFNGVKRNSKNEIIAIKIDVNSDRSSANYQISDDTPINPIKISFNKKDNTIAIGNLKDENVFITSKEVKDSNVFLISSDDDNEEKDVKLIFTTKEDKKEKKYKVLKTIKTDSDSDEENVFIIKKDSNVKWINDNENDVIIEVNDNNNNNNNNNDDIIAIESDNTKIHFNSNKDEPLYLLEGKEITKEKLGKINPDTIQSINVLKGDNAIKKFGSKGKNGVIEIILKK